MKDFWLCFVPLFVSVDAIGVLPMFLGLTEGIEKGPVRRILIQSVLTAMFVALVFLVGGTALLRLLGISIADFMVAGGIMIFVIAMSDLVSAEKRQRKVDKDSLGAVPLGVPLIAGPAVFTTSILLLNSYGAFMTAVSLVLNILIAGGIFSFAPQINSLLGKTGSKIISKIASLLLTAIAIMMIRRGIFLLIAQFIQGL